MQIVALGFQLFICAEYFAAIGNHFITRLIW